MKGRFNHFHLLQYNLIGDSPSWRAASLFPPDLICSIFRNCSTWTNSFSSVEALHTFRLFNWSSDPDTFRSSRVLSSALLNWAAWIVSYLASFLWVVSASVAVFCCNCDVILWSAPSILMLRKLAILSEHSLSLNRLSTFLVFDCVCFVDFGHQAGAMVSSHISSTRFLKLSEPLPSLVLRGLRILRMRSRTDSKISVLFYPVVQSFSTSHGLLVTVAK